MSMVILWICAGIIGAVFGVMLYSVATFRGVSNARLTSRTRNVAIEVLWALVPIVIFIVAAMPVVASMAATR